MQNNEKNKKVYVALFLLWIKNYVFTKVWIKRTLLIFFNLILLFFIITLLLMYSSTFQTIVAKLAARHLSEDLGLEVKIDKLSVDIFHNVHLNNFIIKDDKQDTMIYLNDLNVDIQYSSVFHNKLIISKIRLENPNIYIVRHKGDKNFNYEKLINYFSSNDTINNKDTSLFDLKIKSIELKNANLIYKDEKYNTDVNQQVNYDFIKMKNVNLLMDNMRQEKDAFYAHLKHFSAKEQSGLHVNQMQADIKITPYSFSFKNMLLETSRSVVKGNVQFSYASFDDFLDNIENGALIEADLFPSTKIHFRDLYHFAKELKGWDNYIEVSGKVKGKISDLKITDAKINYAGTQIDGNIGIKGLPDIDKTLFDIQANSLITKAQYIEQIPLYPFENKEFIKLPKQFKNTGLCNFKGNIKGYYHKLKIDGILVTEIGYIKINTLLYTDSISKNFHYKGRFAFNNFHFGKFFKQESIGTLSADVFLDGEGTIFNTMKTGVQADIKTFTFNNYTYKNILADISLNKKMVSGNLSIADDNAQLNFSGEINFDNKIPDMNFTLSVDKLNLNQLHFINDSKDGIFSGKAVIELSGNNIDDMTGEISMNNLQYFTKEKIYYFSDSKMVLKQDKEHHEEIYFHSDFFDIDIEGRFEMSEMNNYINHFMNTFYPSFAKQTYTLKDIGRDSFQISLRIKNFEILGDLLTEKKLFIQPGTQLKLSYYPKRTNLVVKFNSELISYDKIKFINPVLYINSADRQLRSVLDFDKIIFSDSLHLNNIHICSYSQDNITRTNIEWRTLEDSLEYTYDGQIGLIFVFHPNNVEIIPDIFEISTGKEKWIAEKLNPLVIDTAYNINIHPIEFTCGNQSIAISGRLYNGAQDKLKIEFNNFDLHWLNPLLTVNNIKLKGTLNGNLVWYQTLKKPVFSSDVRIKNLYFNNYFIGNITTHVAYQPLNKSLFLKGNLSYEYSQVPGMENSINLKYLSFEGIYYTDKKDSALDIEINANPLNLVMLNPILKDIMTVDYAFVYGKGRITGTPEKPLISGNFKVTDSKIKTDYLNTYHKITGDIKIMPDQINFDEMKIYNYGSKELAGYLNGNIFHTNFSNMRLDFDISAKNLLMLNTNPSLNKDYYGKIYASGTVGIYGFLNNMNIEANLTPQKNSKFILSFTHAEEVGENGFVKFINPKDTNKNGKTSNNITGLRMNFVLNTTPDLETEIILNDKTGDGVRARGEGVIEMNMNSFGKFDITGQYLIHSGTYLFTLESIINKKFSIEHGSKVTFVGNPYNTLLNVTASYVQKASIAPLFPYDSSGTYKRRYPVHSKVILKGRMTSPEILFNIDIPQLDAATKSKIELLLSDENELTRQFFSLLLLKSFVTPLQYANAGGVSAGSVLAANSSEMLSNRLNNSLRGITDFVDIGVNYNPGSQNSNQQMELTMSKQMFNNRLSINGSFGVNSNQAQNSSQIIGDVNIEYKLTPSGKHILKAFNRTNNNVQMTISGGPYTQGIGIGYRYEFDNLLREKEKEKYQTRKQESDEK